jgi:hypothetical protein
MLISDAARAPLIALIPFLHATGLLSFGLLLVLVGATGAFITPSFASKSSILPDLVGEDERVLAEANALLQAANRLAMILGPPLGGALIGLMGATTVLLVDAATFVVGFVLVGTLVRGGTIVDTDETRGLTAGLLFEQPAAGVVATMFLSGLANGIINAPIHAIVMLRTPRALRPKIWSVVIVMTSILGPPFLAATGPALGWAGLRPTLVVLLSLQSISVVWFATAGLRERERVRPLASEAV